MASNFSEIESFPVQFGRYVIYDHLGKGGFATVYRAELQGPAGFRKGVALKILRETSRVSDWGSEQARLMQEARLCGMLSHANVINCYELGIEGERVFMAMELIEGLTLQQLLELAVPPPVIANEIVRGVCKGLDYAHRRRVNGLPLGLVHLDLKPSNVLIGWDGAVKVADFGIAVLQGGAISTERGGSSRGTPSFMSPEQIQHGSVDPRSDLFALGALFFEVYTGERLFNGSTPPAIFERIRSVDEWSGEALEILNDSVDGLATVIGRCVASDPSMRYPDVSTLWDAFQGVFQAPSKGDLATWLSEVLAQAAKREESSVRDAVPLQWTLGTGKGSETNPDAPERTIAIDGIRRATNQEEALVPFWAWEESAVQEQAEVSSANYQRLLDTFSQAGFEQVAEGTHPALVFDSSKGVFWHQGGVVAKWRPNTRAARLLSTLATLGPASRKMLVEQVWDAPYRPPHSDNAFYVCLNALRKRIKKGGLVVEVNADGQYAIGGDLAVFRWRQGRPGPPAPSQEPLPAVRLTDEPDAFFGRERELAALRQHMEKSAVVTLIGPPGSGKSRLARRFAADTNSQQAWEGRVCPCDWEGVDAVGALATLHEAVHGVPVVASEDGIQALGASLSGAELGLIVLDNVDRHVDWLGEALERWRVQAPTVRWIVTCRRPVAGDALTVGPFAAPDPAEVEALSTHPAVALFIHRAREVNPDFVADAEQRVHIAHLVAELDGWPLAIELAAQRVTMLSVERIRDRLSHRFKLLKEQQRGMAMPRQSVEESIGRSWQLLKPWERSALVQCADFVGSFTLEEVEERIDVSAWPEAPWVVDVLGELMSHALVRVDKDKSGPRLSMYANIRAYVTTHLE